VVTANTNFLYCGTGGASCAACALRQACQNGVCTYADAGIGVIGDACTINGDCTAVPTVAGGGPPYCKTRAYAINDSYQYEATYTYPSGMCTRRCTSNTQCGAGSICMSFGGFFGEAENICVPSCPGGTCRAGYTCVNLGGAYGQVCLVATADGGFYDWDAGTPAANNVMGEACTVNSQCKPPPTGNCFTATLPDGGASGYPNGVCYASCTMNPTDAYCGPTTGVCLPDVDQYLDGPLVSWTCSRQCNPSLTTTGCRTEYYCYQIGADTTYGTCIPRCTNPGQSCPSGSTCNTGTGRCT
jgi:hypothetical protein